MSDHYHFYHCHPYFGTAPTLNEDLRWGQKLTDIKMYWVKVFPSTNGNFWTSRGMFDWLCTQTYHLKSWESQQSKKVGLKQSLGLPPMLMCPHWGLVGPQNQSYSYLKLGATWMCGTIYFICYTWYIFIIDMCILEYLEHFGMKVSISTMSVSHWENDKQIHDKCMTRNGCCW